MTLGDKFHHEFNLPFLSISKFAIAHRHWHLKRSLIMSPVFELVNSEIYIENVVPKIMMPEAVDFPTKPSSRA